MEITRDKAGDFVVMRLNGRLDANWCQHVEAALTGVVKGGDHHLHVDMAAVSYISSAGIRVLLTCHKQLRAINGAFGVVTPSEAVRSVLELSGLEMLIASDRAAPAPVSAEGRSHATASARYQVFALGSESMRLEAVGNADLLRRGASSPGSVRRFGAGTVAVGVGALGRQIDEGLARCGEFLAVGGVAAFQPSDGSSRPDFMVSEGALVPEGQLVSGLAAEGSFSLLARFETAADSRAVPLTELAAAALELSGRNVAVIAAITETSGLVGAALRKSPAPAASSPDARVAFPEIREWLSFTSDRAHRDSTSLVVGVVAKAGSRYDAALRPLGRDSGLVGHVHAAAFPYRPLRKGRIELHPSVAELFDGSSFQALLHLISDPRDFNGAGESEFFRGALWIAPVEVSA
jgi:anti-anti-sigma factor